MLDLCQIVSLALHLLAVNLATAAPLVCIWLKRRQRRQGDEAAGALGQFLAWHSLTSLAVGIVFGTLTLGLLWLDESSTFFAALSAVPRRRLWFGLVELVFFFACMGGYAWGWRRMDRRPWLHHGLAVLAATDLIYHFPPLFAAIATLQSRPALWGTELGYREFLAVLLEAETIGRVVHFLLASLAVTGAAILVFALRLARRGEATEAGRLAGWGGRLALAPTLLQLLAGMYLMWALPTGQRAQLLGGDWLAAVLFLASGLAMFSLLHHLAALSLGDSGLGEIRRALALMGLVVLLMVGARHYIRPQAARLMRPAAMVARDRSSPVYSPRSGERGYGLKQPK